MLGVGGGERERDVYTRDMRVTGVINLCRGGVGWGAGGTPLQSGAFILWAKLESLLAGVGANHSVGFSLPGNQAPCIYTSSQTTSQLSLDHLLVSSQSSSTPPHTRHTVKRTPGASALIPRLTTKRNTSADIANARHSLQINK